MLWSCSHDRRSKRKYSLGRSWLA